MSAIPVYLLRHTITVEAFTGDGPFGPTFGPPVPVRCLLDESTQLARSGGVDQVTANATAYAPVPAAEQVPVGSRVTLPSGRVTTVTAAAVHTGGGLPTPDHVQITLI